MPPRSRGKLVTGVESSSPVTTAATSSSRSALTSHRTFDEHREQQRRTRARNASLRMQDPLTLLLTLVTYPLLVVALGLLHSTYYVVLKVRASERMRRSAAAIKQSPWSRRRRWRQGMSYAARCDEDAKLRMLTRSQQVDQQPCKQVSGKLGTSATTTVIPAHVALALGAKPARTTTLFARMAMLPFQTPAERVASPDAYDAEQERFAMISMLSAVRCCAIAGIETLTVYDEGGYLANAFRDSHQKSLLDEIVVERLPPSSERERKGERPEKQEVASSVPLQIEATIMRPFQQQASASGSHINGNGNGNVAQADVDETIARRICIYVLDPDDAEGALARAASLIAAQRKEESDGGSRSMTNALKMTPDKISDVLRANSYPSDPDLLIVHGGARQVSTLLGFPPWLVRLCEIYHDADASPYAPLSPSSFERALHAYSRSEQRHGK